MFQGKLKGGLIVSVYRYDIEIVYIYIIVIITIIIINNTI